MKKCEVVYQGPTYPEYHGTKCEMGDVHPGFRHCALVNAMPLTWWTEEEKVEIRRNRG